MPGSDRELLQFLLQFAFPLRTDQPPEVDPHAAKIHGLTRKGTLLESVPPGVTTCTMPLVAPAGTVVVMNEFESTINVAAVPLNVTLVAPFRLLPRTVIVFPTLPDGGRVSTNGPRPTDRLKTEPWPPVPPPDVVP
jgi:hypothetical protein